MIWLNLNFSIDKRTFICYNSQANKQRLVGQAVKTLASHAENMGSIPVRVTKTKGHPSRVSFLFCCDSVGIDPLERKAFGYGFVTLLRPSLWEACKTEQIPVQNLDGSMPERFFHFGVSYVESHPMGIAARPHPLPFVPRHTIHTNICSPGKIP